MAIAIYLTNWHRTGNAPYPFESLDYPSLLQFTWLLGQVHKARFPAVLANNVVDPTAESLHGCGESNTIEFEMTEPEPACFKKVYPSGESQASSSSQSLLQQPARSGSSGISLTGSEARVRVSYRS